MKPYYLTTPIYYVNDKPHIGHAYTTLACDVLARFKRLDGYSVKFLTGTDEHGQKVQAAAEKAGVSPQEFTDTVSQNFRDLLVVMNFSNDQFIRTTEPRHYKSCQAIWKRLMDKGFITLDKYEGWYSIRDEAFFTETELVDGKAQTGAPVLWVEEPSYFFNLSEWQQPLLDYYEANPNFIAPESKRKEVISFVSGGLKDLSVSRTTFDWGVPVPGHPEHIMYVWLDALTNYITALDWQEQGTEFERFWPADLHLVGNDILRFHAVYLPAFLMAAELPLPKRVFAHGWWTNEGQKISKSLGNVIDPLRLVDEFGCDQTRYFLLREVPFGNDGDFSKAALINRINSDLVNDLGNLCQRSLTMIEKKCDSIIPMVTKTGEYENRLKESSDAILSKGPKLINEFKIHDYIKLVWGHISKVNKYFNDNKPWELEKNNEEMFLNVLAITAEQIKNIAFFICPIMPDTSKEILKLIGINDVKLIFDTMNRTNVFGNKLLKINHLFKRV